VGKLAVEGMVARMNCSPGQLEDKNVLEDKELAQMYHLGSTSRKDIAAPMLCWLGQSVDSRTLQDRVWLGIC
jgi:hypothetical protein